MYLNNLTTFIMKRPLKLWYKAYYVDQCMVNWDKLMNSDRLIWVHYRQSRLNIILLKQLN